jgi:hypothetical protein
MKSSATGYVTIMNIEIKEDRIIINYDIVMSIDTVIKSIEYTRKWLDTLIEAKRLYDETVNAS